jgi:hypothetical protein
MKRGLAVAVAALLALVLGVVPVAAQQSPSGKPSVPGDTQGMPPGMPGMPGGTHGTTGSAMMCPMMMSMMGAQVDPRVMQMHGEMMKAMGDIMMKHGKMLEGSGTR